jgi:hypothetical protein
MAASLAPFDPIARAELVRLQIGLGKLDQWDDRVADHQTAAAGRTYIASVSHAQLGYEV